MKKIVYISLVLLVLSACLMTSAACGNKIETKDCVRIHGKLDAAIADQAVYYLPIVQDSAAVAVETGALLSHGKSFNLNPGFICTEYKIAANEQGEFALTLSV